MLIHNIDPVLLKISSLPLIGTLEIRYYGVLYAIGIASGYFMTQSFFKKRGYSEDIFSKLILYIIAGLILGAHYGHILFYEPESIINNPIRLLQLGKGLASHGGFIGAIIALFLFKRRMAKGEPSKLWTKFAGKKDRDAKPFDYKTAAKISFFEYTDLITIGGALLVPFIRFGNFFNSEIVGRVISKINGKPTAPFAIAFKRLRENHGKLDNELIWRHPSQLYEMVIGIAIFLTLFFFFRKYYDRIKNGTIFFGFIILYFTSRFLIEYVKEYQALSTAFPFTMGQMLSIPLVLLGIFMFVKFKFYKLDPPKPE